MNSIGILWVQYGPYHLARARALRQLAGPAKIHSFELSNLTTNYKWKRGQEATEVTTLCAGIATERLSFHLVFKRTREYLIKRGIQVCLIPGYSPAQPMAALLAARSAGVKAVMMNESHAGTARTGKMSTWVKRQFVRMFDAALVGGQPQKRYYASLGLPEEKIFTGYDAVDNDYFAGRSEEIRSRVSEVKNSYALPDHYFLSLGRFVSKKNLANLIQAYRRFLDTQPASQTHLVFVGDGIEEDNLRSLCAKLRLRVWDKSAVTMRLPMERNNFLAKDTSNSITSDGPGVHFYGFRQIEENPVFYALADAFFLPSLYEEWGLVVNEAMASGLPVVVSETAGCVEDLLGSDPAKLRPTESINSLNNPARAFRGIRENGFVINPHSVEDLANAMNALAAFPNLRRDMGQASQRIVAKCSCQQFAENALRAVRAALEPGYGSRSLSGAPSRKNCSVNSESI